MSKIKVGTAYYNNWRQNLEFVVISATFKWEENGALHLGLGFLGFGVETFITSNSEPQESNQE